MAEYLTWILISLPALAWLYWKLHQTFTFWSSRGVPGPAPLYLIGNMHQLLGANRGPGDLARTQQFGKLFGYYAGSQPVLVVNDAALIKQILVKDFQHFANRQKQKIYHKLWHENLFNAEDERWRRVRTITSPAFTSGKLRAMHGLMERCIDRLIEHLDGIVRLKHGLIESTKETVASFTIDVIASTSFATETRPYQEGAGKSPFVTNGHKFFWINPLRGLGIILSPKWVLDLLQVQVIFSPSTFQWFIDLSREIVRKRRASGTKRNDFVQLLLDAAVDEAELEKTTFEQLTADVERENTVKTAQPKASLTSSSTVRTLTDDEVIAQMILFFAAGFETTASTLLHGIFELLHNPTVQEQLFTEIKSATAELTDTKSSEYFERVVNGIPYLEATIKEVLRLYPPVTVLFRRVKSDSYTLNGIKLLKDQHIEINSYAVHHSAEYYPDPERFDPDRFMPQYKDKLVPYTFLPFGQGPRNCVGMRFAYQELKLCLAKIVTLYRFEPTSETPTKLTFKRASPMLNTLSYPCKISKRI